MHSISRGVNLAVSLPISLAVLGLCIMEVSSGSFSRFVYGGVRSRVVCGKSKSLRKMQKIECFEIALNTLRQIGSVRIWVTYQLFNRHGQFIPILHEDFVIIGCTYAIFRFESMISVKIEYAMNEKIGHQVYYNLSTEHKDLRKLWTTLN